MVVLIELIAVWCIDDDFEEQSHAVSVDTLELSDAVLTTLI